MIHFGLFNRYWYIGWESKKKYISNRKWIFNCYFFSKFCWSIMILGFYVNSYDLKSIRGY